MIDKDILNRISKLEERIPLFHYDIDEYIAQTIKELENFLGYSIKENIDFSKLDYTNIDFLERSIISCLSIEELKKIAYGK